MRYLLISDIHSNLEALQATVEVAKRYEPFQLMCLGDVVGYGADPMAVQILAERGIDISAHRARNLTEAMVCDAELILVMDTLQKLQILARYPFALGKVFRLGEDDIADPYQQGPEAFYTAFSLIENVMDEWVRRINNIG